MKPIPAKKYVSSGKGVLNGKGKGKGKEQKKK
jgi:hypothetical protein